MQAKFMCIGFQKCGTTTMYDILKQHDGIVLTRDVKEPMFYRVIGARALLGKKWYENRYFGHVSPKDTRLPGEINAMLSTTNTAPKIIKDFPQDTKLIFMMRNPVDRAYSAYKYFLALGFLPPVTLMHDKFKGHTVAFKRYCNFILRNPKKRELIMKARLRYLVFSQGRYMKQMKEFLSYFPKENVKCIFFEDFIKDQEGVCKDLYKFLGVEDDPNVEYNLKSNEGTLKAGPGFSCYVGALGMAGHHGFYEFLDTSRRFPTFNEKYAKFNAKLQAYCVREDDDHSKMDNQTRKLLERYYRNDVLFVEQFTGRDLSDIWYDAHCK